jgi:ribosomal protein S19
MSLDTNDKTKCESLNVIQKNIQSKEMTKAEVMRTYGVEIEDRSASITPEFVDRVLKIHKGNGYVPVEIKKEHVGLKLGSLVRSKRIPEYKKKKK